MQTEEPKVWELKTKEKVLIKACKEPVFSAINVPKARAINHVI